jgi:hypothetical protein
VHKCTLRALGQGRAGEEAHRARCTGSGGMETMPASARAGGRGVIRAIAGQRSTAQRTTAVVYLKYWRLRSPGV